MAGGALFAPALSILVFLVSFEAGRLMRLRLQQLLLLQGTVHAPANACCFYRMTDDVPFSCSRCDHAAALALCFAAYIFFFWCVGAFLCLNLSLSLSLLHLQLASMEGIPLNLAVQRYQR
jgi:hypothetical protein